MTTIIRAYEVDRLDVDGGPPIARSLLNPNPDNDSPVVRDAVVRMQCRARMQAKQSAILDREQADDDDE